MRKYVQRDYSNTFIVYTQLHIVYYTIPLLYQGQIIKLSCSVSWSGNECNCIITQGRIRPESYSENSRLTSHYTNIG